MADDVIDSAILNHVVVRNSGALVAFQEPSSIEQVDKITLCTYDDLQEVWFNDHENSRPIVVVRPKRYLLQKMISLQNRRFNSFGVYLTFPDALTEFEYSIKIHDLLGDCVGNIDYVEKLELFSKMLMLTSLLPFSLSVLNCKLKERLLT